MNVVHEILSGLVVEHFGERYFKIAFTQTLQLGSEKIFFV
jgi:hypothetical protein